MLRWSTGATQIYNCQQATFSVFLSSPVLQQLPMRLFLSAVGSHRAPLCFSVAVICLLSVSDKECFMEMHPYSRHLNGVRWSGVRAGEVVVCHWCKMQKGEKMSGMGSAPGRFFFFLHSYSQQDVVIRLFKCSKSVWIWNKTQRHKNLSVCAATPGGLSH